MFERVVKYLDLRKATKDETLVTKPLSINKARAIKKLQDTLTIPPRLYFSVDLLGVNPPRLLFQYNVTVGYSFSFRIDSGNTRLGQMYVKWRNGTTVTRYRIPIDAYATAPFAKAHALLQQDVVYVEQRVPSNCVFEFWLLDSPIGFLSAGLENALVITLSRLRNPSTSDDVGSNSNATVIMQLADLGVALPETLPYNQANLAWLDNA